VTALVARSPITDAVLVKLRTLSGVTVYDAEVPDDPPTISVSDLRVKPYVVLYPLGSQRGVEPSVSGDDGDIRYGCQVTCVGGHRKDAEFLADRVDALLYHWTPAVDGVVFGRFEPPAGYDAGSVRPDLSVSPPRFYIPLDYRCRATR